MSIWQRIAAFLSALGDSIAGSITAILDPDNWMPGGRDAAFTMSIIALSAKMAVADGIVSPREMRTFHKLVDIPEGADEHVERFFALAQQDVAGFDTYARKVRKLFIDSPASLEHVLDALFEIATADGIVHERELAYLKAISDIFGFDDVRFEQIARQHVIMPNGRRDPYAVLGLIPDATDEELRRTYRRLVAEHHPDRMIAKGVPEELMGLATTKMAAINAAYGEISQARGLKPAIA
ncbi:TerB family tellurite resistance protein [Pelagibacterium montanilacus]|uniref:TerB family tellurite resistance protein n=1 Tax=Pelagibacterium montanilacus TaxID=2185280 RepID=UPI000F8EBD7A|nr:DnaJ family molecular chaperone [Pelagibacterium montanilacus]